MAPTSSKPPTGALPRLYSVREAAEYVGCSIKTVRRWIKSGDLPHHRLGRQIRISERDLEQFVRMRRHD
jgi:excisionase family DNA binding protein